MNNGKEAPNQAAARFDVLHVIRPAAGGMKNHLRALLRGMARKGVRVLAAGPEPLVSALREDGFAVRAVEIEPGFRVERQLAAVWRLARLAREHRVAVLHTHGAAAALVACPAARLAGVPVAIVTAHGSPRLGSPWRQRAGVAAQRAALRLADRVIAVADCLRAELLTLGLAQPERVVTVHNGIAPAGFEARADGAALRAALGLPPGRPVIGIVARLAPQKGVEHLVRALAQLDRDGRGATLLVAGDGPLRDRLENEARELGVVAVFLGYRGDVAEILGALDVFVLPSVTEGLPLVVLEAMAAGCPVVATRVGGIPEAVRDGETGWLVPPADPDALARAIHHALGDRARAAAYAAAGRERVRRLFTAERMVEKTLAVYREALLAAGFGELGIVF
jgi:glycosyltransferase involved in cell wall biosynthesis